MYYSTKCFQLNVFVGTVNAAGYLSMIHQMKELITRAGKKAYTLVMGKPNPAKLANFPEVNFATEKKKKRGKKKTFAHHWWWFSYWIFIDYFYVFSQCDVFIYVSCAQTALLDSKEFLAPVITPFEAMLAFNRYWSKIFPIYSSFF